MAKHSSKHWIEDMHMKKGAEKASAQKAGMSTSAYAAKTANSSNPKTKKRALLAKTLMGMNKGKK